MRRFAGAARNRDILGIAVATLILVAVPSYATPTATSSADAVFDRAMASRVAELADSPGAETSEETKALFSTAADLFESSASESGMSWYEAGNARWWSGSADRAILDYRRALARDPFRGAAWQNLSEARKDAGTADPGHEAFLGYPWHVWFASFAAFFAGLAFFCLSFFLLTGKSRRRSIAVGSLAIAVGFGAGAALTLALRKPMAVFAVETQGRKGDSAAYAPYPEKPWPSGQEAWVIERRDTWVRVRVGSTFSWVQSASLSPVD